MKAILVFTAALMTGASIYGVANYQQLSNTKDFKELYTEKKEPENPKPVLILNEQEKKEPAVAPQPKSKKVMTVRNKAKRKVAHTIKPQKKVEIIAVDEPTIVDEEKIAQPAEAPKKSKTLNRKMFSRAALKE